jgi:hypothetical protein
MTFQRLVNSAEKFVRGQKNEFHALEKCYNYFPQSTIEEIDIPISSGFNSLSGAVSVPFLCLSVAQVFLCRAVAHFVPSCGTFFAFPWHISLKVFLCRAIAHFVPSRGT